MAKNGPTSSPNPNPALSSSTLSRNSRNSTSPDELITPLGLISLESAAAAAPPEGRRSRFSTIMRSPSMDRLKLSRDDITHPPQDNWGAALKKLQAAGEKIYAELDRNKTDLSTGSEMTQGSTEELVNSPLLTILIKLCAPPLTEQDEVNDIIGLSEAFSLEKIICALDELVRKSRFQYEQMRLLTRLIVHDRFNESYQDPNFLNNVLKPLFKDFEAIFPLFAELIASKQETLLLSQSQSSLRGKVSKKTLRPIEELFPPQLKKRQLNSIAKSIAQELRSLTLQFYQELKPSEFRDQAWKKKDKENTSPTIINQQRLFNKISAYFIRRILTAENESQRISTLKLIIKILQELTEKNPVDFNSATAVLSALDHHSISRLELFSHPHLHQKYSSKKDKISTLFDTKNNYDAQRQAMAKINSPYFPFLGILLRDLTFGTDGNGDLLYRCSVKGKIYRPLFSCLDSLREVEIAPQFALLSFLQAAPDLDDEEDRLTRLSYAIKPSRSSINFPVTEASPSITPAFNLALAAAPADPDPIPPSESAKPSRRSKKHRK